MKLARKKMLKAIAAAVVAPVLFGEIVAIFWGVAFFILGQSPDRSIFDVFPFIVIYILPTLITGFVPSLAFCLILGMPGFFFLRWRGAHRIWQYALASAVIGVVVVVLAKFFPSFNNLIFLLPVPTPFMEFASPVVATTAFWCFYRPDRNLEFPR